MTSQEWIIDTTILVHACKPTEESHLDAQEFVQVVRRLHTIALDSQGHMRGEYERNLGDNSSFRLWWDAVWNAGKAVRRDGRLPNRHRRHLTDRLKFDRDDLPFVAVASRGSSKLLATEDSDYDSQVRDYLSSALGVSVLNTAAALERAAG